MHYLILFCLFTLPAFALDPVAGEELTEYFNLLLTTGTFDALAIAALVTQGVMLALRFRPSFWRKVLTGTGKRALFLATAFGSAIVALKTGEDAVTWATAIMLAFGSAGIQNSLYKLMEEMFKNDK